MIKNISIEDKARLLSAASDWTTAPLDKHGISAVRLSDGPSGIRAIADEAKGTVMPSVCYPSPSTLACSWDTELVYNVGQSVADEAAVKNIDIILAPGVNIKRSPLCGRNFEYYSEDPLLAGSLGSAYVNGVQSRGVGACLKHFAANNQETHRAVVSSEVDERTLNEIYLKPFERVVKSAQPYAVMAAYNKLNGVYASENRYLLTDTLRSSWGYKGVVISDWGAVNDRVNALKSGLDIEFPSSYGHNMRRIVDAYNCGLLTMDEIDCAVERVLALIDRIEAAKGKRTTDNATQVSQNAESIAKRAARESIVMLKNEGNILPLKKSVKTLILGELAKSPVYQGRGSSRVNPYNVTSALDGLDNMGVKYAYEQGYRAGSDKPEFNLTETAYKEAGEYKQAVLFLGLNDGAESEGSDRLNIDLSENQYKLAETVLELNPNTVIVIQGGAPVDITRLKSAKAILFQGLSGSHGDTVCDIIFGEFSPCGKLAESYLKNIKDNPSQSYYAIGNNATHYKETIYTGYRYYETYDKDVAFCFGHGLSYTAFEYSNLKVVGGQSASDSLKVTVTLTNTGDYDGAEIVQVYVAPQAYNGVNRAAMELKGFAKIQLNRNESKTVVIDCGTCPFDYYNTLDKGWACEGGEFLVRVGASVKDIRLSEAVSVSRSGGADAPDYGIDYSRFYITDDDFERLLRKKPAEINVAQKLPYTLNSTLNDLSATLIGRKFRQILLNEMRKRGAGELADIGIDDIPIRMLANNSRGMLSYDTCNALIDTVNRRGFFGLRKLISTIKKGR